MHVQYTHIYIYKYIATVNEKETEFNNREKFVGGFGSVKRRGRCDYKVSLKK